MWEDFHLTHVITHVITHFITHSSLTLPAGVCAEYIQHAARQAGLLGDSQATAVAAASAGAGQAGAEGHGSGAIGLSYAVNQPMLAIVMEYCPMGTLYNMIGEVRYTVHGAGPRDAAEPASVKNAVLRDVHHSRVCFPNVCVSIPFRRFSCPYVSSPYDRLSGPSGRTGSATQRSRL